MNIGKCTCISSFLQSVMYLTGSGGQAHEARERAAHAAAQRAASTSSTSMQPSGLQQALEAPLRAESAALVVRTEPTNADIETRQQSPQQDPNNEDCAPVAQLAGRLTIHYTYSLVSCIKSRQSCWACR